MLSRRKFLQMLGIGGAALVLPATGLFRPPQNVFESPELAKFNPRVHYGDYVLLTEDPRGLSAAERRELLDLIKEQIACVVPRRYWGRVKVSSPEGGVTSWDPLAQRHIIKWEYTP